MRAVERLAQHAEIVVTLMNIPNILKILKILKIHLNMWFQELRLCHTSEIAALLSEI